jgi:hypothetical protein
MSDHAISNAKNWLSDIVEMVTDLAEAEKSDEIECGQCEGTGTTQSASNGKDEECPVCDGSGYIAREEDADSIRDRIQEGPLSLQVRTGWHQPGEDAKPEEFELLLSTGGPALRLIGELDQGQPYGTLRLEWQDWGTPWTPLYDTSPAEDAALFAYAGCFYFGD